MLLLLPWSAFAQAGAHRFDVEVALHAADDLERRGAYDAARRQLLAVLRHVSPDEAEMLTVRLCNVWQRQGNLGEARRCYVELTPHLSDSECRAIARYRAAALVSALGDETQARDELTQLVDDAPYTDGARRAFIMARQMHREADGPEGEADFLMGVASRLAWVGEPGAQHNDHEEPPAHELLAEALVEVGRIRLAEVHDIHGAQRILQRAELVARGTTWEDDAQIWLARSLRLLERRDEALILYRTLIEAQKSSWFIGEYASEFYDDALYEVGETLEEMRMFDEAQKAYAEMFRRVPTSRLLDDAAYRLATINVQRSGSTAPFVTFSNQYPDSRHVRAARNAALIK